MRVSNEKILDSCENEENMQSVEPLVFDPTPEQAALGDGNLQELLEEGVVILSISHVKMEAERRKLTSIPSTTYEKNAHFEYKLFTSMDHDEREVIEKYFRGKEEFLAHKTEGIFDTNADTDIVSENEDPDQTSNEIEPPKLTKEQKQKIIKVFNEVEKALEEASLKAIRNMPLKEKCDALMQRHLHKVNEKIHKEAEEFRKNNSGYNKEKFKNIFKVDYTDGTKKDNSDPPNTILDFDKLDPEARQYAWLILGACLSSSDQDSDLREDAFHFYFNEILSDKETMLRQKASLALNIESREIFQEELDKLQRKKSELFDQIQNELDPDRKKELQKELESL